jgi:uncharacterized membrane protein YphA (DoxX/SURF4 family)
MKISEDLSRFSSSISFLARIVLGGIFIYSGTVKILDPSGFAQAVSNYRIIPDWLVNPFALVLPWIETVAGISMILGIWIPGGSLVIGSLLLVFTIALSAALIRGLDISCGCFSTTQEGQTITWSYLVRDIILFIMTGFVFLRDTGLASLERVFSRGRHSTEQ